MIREPLDVSIVTPATGDRGFIAHLEVGPDRVIGVGGTYEPLVMLSSTGRQFTQGHATPRGLRSAVFGSGWVAVAGEYGTLAVTTDVDALVGAADSAGWIDVETGTSDCLFAAHRGPDGVLWLFGDDGYIARITGVGEPSPDLWRVERVTTAITGRVFGATTLGGAVVAWLGDGRLAWLAVTDTGVTADIRETGARAPLTAVVETPTGAIVVSGDDGFLARSTDRGHTFTRVASGTSLAIEDLTVIADGRLVAVGGRGTLLVSDDDGVTFTSVDSGVKQTLWSVVAFGAGVLIGGDDSLILRFAPASDKTWFDRADVFGGSGVLDTAFASGPEAFLDEGLFDYLAAVCPDYSRPELDDEPDPDPTPVSASIIETIDAGVDVDDEEEKRFAQFYGPRDPEVARQQKRAYRLLSLPGDADDFAANWGMPLPDQMRRFLHALSGGVNTWSTFNELRLDNDLLPNLPESENLFELVMLRDQPAYLGTGLGELFSGAIGIGSQGNGDTYHLAVYPGTDDDDQPRRPQVLHYDHDAHGFSDIFADSVASLVYLCALGNARDKRLLSDSAYQSGLRALYGRVLPTWHFSIRDKAPDFTPLDSYTTLSEFFFYRSRWIQLLLKAGTVHDIADAREVFHAPINGPIDPAVHEQRLANCRAAVPTALYAMWRAYIFDEPELDDILTVCAAAPARITRDSAALITELRAGTRTRLGSIADVGEWLTQIRALDLDPRRAEDREREAVEAARRADELAAAYAAELAEVDPHTPDGLRLLTQLAWEHLDDQTYHHQVLATLCRDPRRAALVDRVIEVAAMSSRAEPEAATALAPELDPVIDVLLIGPLTRDDDYQHVDDDSDALARRTGALHKLGAHLLVARAKLGLLDQRAVPALRPLLEVEEEYNHRRACAVAILGELQDRGSIATIVDMINKSAIRGSLDSIGKERLFNAVSQALTAMPDPVAIDALAGVVAPQERYYDKVRGAAAAALAACLATVDGDRDVSDDVLDGLLFTMRENVNYDANFDSLFAYGLVARELSPRGRAHALDKLAATPNKRNEDIITMGRAAVIAMAGGDSSEDLDTMLVEALTSRSWDHDATVGRLDRVLRVAAEFPDLVDPGCVHWITRFPESSLRDRAHRLLTQIGAPLEPAPVFDDSSVQTLTDDELVASIIAEHVVGRGVLIGEATRRQLSAARSAVISVVHGVIRPAKPQEPLRHDRDALNAAVAYLVAGELTDEVIACLDEILRHPSSDVRWDLMHAAPKDPRLIPAMQHVAGLKWGWQEDAALDWLSEVSA